MRLAVFDRQYRGSHLSVMVELLAGPLVGNSGASADNYGNLVLAFDPELLGDSEGFQRDVESVLARHGGKQPAMPASPADDAHGKGASDGDRVEL